MKSITSFIKSHKVQQDILLVFLSFISVICAIIIWFGHAQNSKSTLLLAGNLMKLTSESILGKTEDFFDDIENQSQMGGALYKNLKDLSLNKDKFSHYFLEMLRINPYIELYEIGTTEGNYLAVGRVGANQTYVREPSKRLPQSTTYMIQSVERKGDVPVEIRTYINQEGNVLGSETINNSSYDPRKRSWYEAVIRSFDPYWVGVLNAAWSDVYSFADTGKLGFTLSLPIISDNKELIAISGTNVSLELFSVFLSDQVIEKTGNACIFDRKGHIIATSNRYQGEKKRISNLDNIFQAAYHNFQKAHKSLFVHRIDGVDYICNIVPFPVYDEGWMVGIVAPKDDYLGLVNQASKINIFISISIILISWFVIIYFSKRISIPILKISEEADKIKHFDLEDEIKIDSPIEEIHYLREALSSMKSALKSFSYYIPKDIVRQLIEKGQEIRLGSEKKEITIFFIDLVNFTSITESLPMDQFMPQFFEFLDKLSEVIIQSKGTIDKYIGDNIMAFWGAPQEIEDPDLHACKAALLCQYKLIELNQKWKSKGQVELFARIGINSGAVIVGNIGTEQRINYTAIGDPVNLASRLEQINKNYETKILISERVQKKVFTKYLTRPIDIVNVKGKHEKIKIFELVGMYESDINIAPTIGQINLAKEFAKGFEMYHQGQWESALNMFEAIHEKFPFDKPTLLYIQRCRDHLKSPQGQR